MTRIGHQNLTAAKRTGFIAYQRTLEYLVIYNSNPVPLYIRLGSEEIPNELNYDIAVPPSYIMAISVDSNQFGFRLGAIAASSSLITGVSVIEATIDEPPPALGGVPIIGASLGTADFLNGLLTFTGVTVYAPFNLSLWGGMIVNVIPTAGSGQGVIQIDVSPDATTWTPYQTWAFWPNIPATLIIPRVSTFARVTVNATGIIGEPGIAGQISILGVLTQVLQPSYTPIGNAITKTYTLTPNAAQQFSFVVIGLPAISIAAIATAGSGANAAIILNVESSTDGANWRKVTDRTQRMSSGITLYRAVGNLGIFLRVTVLEASGTDNANGTVYLSIPPVADLGYILNTIQQSLGDISTPVNNRQDILHELKFHADSELDAIRVATQATKLTIDNININDANTQVNTLGIKGDTAHLAAIDTNMLSAANSALYLPGISSYVSTLPTIQTNTAHLAAMDTAIANINTNIANININDANTQINTLALASNANRGASAVGGSVAYPAAGVWVLFTTVSVGSYIESIFGSILANNGLPGGSMSIALGTASAPTLICYSFFHSNSPAGAGLQVATTGPTLMYGGPRSGGLLCSSGLNSIWLLDSAATGSIGASFSYSS